MNSKTKKIRIKMFNFLYFKKIISIIISIVFVINISKGQSSENLPCYSIAQEIDEPAVLYEYNPTSRFWRSVGSTNMYGINSIAIDSKNSIIYAVDGGALGYLNPVTAEFTFIGEIGSGDGDFGNIAFDNIQGLAYHPLEQILVATHNVAGFSNTTNDLLLKIDPLTGKAIKETMIDSSGTSLVDYARIEKTNSWTIGALTIRDINDIAIHPYSGELYAFHKQGKPAVLTILNQEDGNVEQVINDVSELNVGGLGFDSQGDLYGTSMADFLDNTLSTYRKFDIFVGTSESLGPIDPEVGDRTSFICFDCSKEIVKIESCETTNINITNFVYGGPNYSTIGSINSNASTDYPVFYQAGDEINLLSNFEILVGPAFSVNPQVLFSAEIGNCQ